MLPLRRRLASCAFVLCLIQAAALFAAPLVACCDGAAAPGVHHESDCCPPGSHAPGQCPLHRDSTRPAAASHCRMTCGHPASTIFLLMPVGVLGAPTTIAATLTHTPIAATRTSFPASVPADLSAPPPKA